MKKPMLWLSALLVLALALGCQAPLPSSGPTPVPATAIPSPALSGADAEYVLELVGPTGTKMLSLAEIKALPAVDGWAGIKNSVGRITPPAPHKGVSIEQLCGLVGGLTADNAVEIAARDGYAMSMSYNEVVNGELITYDPGTGSEIKINDPLRVILAYEREGKPLPAESDGVLRLAVVSPKNNQVTDGHWTVKWVTKLVIKSLSRDWTLNLVGKLSEAMDRATFESGATPCCHRRIWTDETGQVWSGIPLWHLVGRVDDDLKHQAGAFNDVLAGQGYTIDIVASDGYTLSFDSGRVRYNNNLIVANQMNGKPLEDKYFALRLVGSDLQKKEMVGQIEKIVLHLPESAARSPGTTPLPGPATTVPVPSGVALTIAGEVEKELALKLEDLKAMQIEIQAEHPTEGMQTFQGARISDLLGKAGLKAGVKYLVLVSGDGARTEMPFGLLGKCPDCLVGFSYDGRLNAVMPTMDCYFWVKDLVRIELQ